MTQSPHTSFSSEENHVKLNTIANRHSWQHPRFLNWMLRELSPQWLWMGLSLHPPPHPRRKETESGFATARGQATNSRQDIPSPQLPRDGKDRGVMNRRRRPGGKQKSPDFTKDVCHAGPHIPDRCTAIFLGDSR